MIQMRNDRIILAWAQSLKKRKEAPSTFMLKRRIKILGPGCSALAHF